MSGDAVLLKTAVFGPVTECVLLWISTDGPRPVGVEVLPGPDSRGGEYPFPIFVGGGEPSPRTFRPGLVGVDAERP